MGSTSLAHLNGFKIAFQASNLHTCCELCVQVMSVVFSRRQQKNNQKTLFSLCTQLVSQLEIGHEHCAIKLNMYHCSCHNVNSAERTHKEKMVKIRATWINY